MNIFSLENIFLGTLFNGLTLKERQILSLLSQKELLSKSEIEGVIFDGFERSKTTLNVHVSNIRKKLKRIKELEELNPEIHSFKGHFFMKTKKEKPKLYT